MSPAKIDDDIPGHILNIHSLFLPDYLWSEVRLSSTLGLVLMSSVHQVYAKHLPRRELGLSDGGEGGEVSGHR